METIDNHTSRIRSGSDLLEVRAARAGFELISRLTDTGQVVWEWRCGDEPRPQFVTEHVARRWMSDFLSSTEPAAGS